MASVLITTFEHAYATAIGDIKKAAKYVESAVLPLLLKVEAAAPTVEAVTALVSPTVASIERVGDAVLGAVIAAIEAAGAAAGGVSLTLDADLVADIKSIIPAVKAAAVTPVVPAPPAV